MTDNLITIPALDPERSRGSHVAHLEQVLEWVYDLEQHTRSRRDAVGGVREGATYWDGYCSGTEDLLAHLRSGLEATISRELGTRGNSAR